MQHRYHCTPAKAVVRREGERAQVDFLEPQMSVTPGQGAAFYWQDRLIGGGWIASTTRMGIAAAEGSSEESVAAPAQEGQ